MDTLAEDMLLLALDDDKGTVSWHHDTAVQYGLGGALLMDLALQERIRNVGQTIVVRDPSPTGDVVLDASLETISSSAESHDAQHWVKKLSGQPDLKDWLARGLVRRGILREEEHTFLWVFASPRYPTGDPGPEKSLRDQIRDVVLAGIEPDTRTLMLLSLINACGLTDGVFAEEERRNAKRRIQGLIEDEQFGKAVGKAIADTVVAITAAVNAAVFTVTIAPGAS